MTQTSNGLTYQQLINTPLVDPIDKLLFQKHQQEIYKTLNSFGLITGKATLVGGTVLVTNSMVKTTSLIFGFPQDSNTTGILSGVAGNGSFSLNSTVNTDAGVVAWLLVP